jgi:PAS domain S-box-containing protein
LTTAPVGIFQTDAVGNMIFLNQQCLELMGATLSAALGQGWANSLHPDDRARVSIQWYEAVQANHEFSTEHRFLTPQGRVNWVFVKAIGICNEAGIVTGYIGMVMDITERQAALRERKASEQKIQEQAALLNIATDAIIVRDLDSQIQFWNNGATAIYGWSPIEAIDRTTAELFYPDLLPEANVETAFRDVLERGSWQGELHKLTKTGKAITVESRWTLVRDEAGNPTSILSVDTDITEKKSLEQQFLRAQRLESLGSLASGIAHDLNIEIQVNYASEDLWMVSVDATQIHQVLMNLFVNARDAMPDGGSLTASAENIMIGANDALLQLQIPQGAYILITITDTGIGMTSAILDRIFDPFFTTKETRKSVQY